MKAGIAVFTSVQQNMGWGRYCETIDYVRSNLDSICSRLIKSDTLEEYFVELIWIQNIGDFFAWQILCDLTESRVINVTELDDWTALGPGAVKGIKLIFPGSTRLIERTRTLTKICQQAK